MVRRTKYTGPGLPSSHLKRKEEAPRKNKNPRKKEKVCGRACRSRRLWWVGRACRSLRLCGLVVTRLGPSVTGCWCFWRSDVPGHSIAGGVWGSEGCGQQLPGGVGPSGVYTGVYGRQGRGWFGSLVLYAGHTTAEGPDGCASQSPRLLGIVVAVYAS